MPITKEVKGTLAKLLATENLTVEHRKVSTASFDVNNRVLVLPIWDASETVYDLLVGHEVGHALYTPNVPVDAPKGFVNVIEDARIERLMKQTYPGLRKTFFEGYRELWHQDFFGCAEEDPNKLSLIDRINLYFKGSSQIEFTDEEKVFVDRAGKTNTFEDVIELSNDLYDYAKEKDALNEDLNPEQPDFQMDLPQDTDEQEEVTPDDEGDSLDTDTDDGEDGSGDGEGEREEEERESYETDLDVPSYKEGADCVSETEAKTDVALKQALETLVNDDAREWVYLDLPKVNVEKAIVGWEEIQEDLYYHFEGQAFRDVDEQTYYNGNIEYARDHYYLYKKEAQKSVNYLLKQFEMKKSADDYQRTATSKSGVIDTNSLHKYKLTDDIFRRIQIVPEGKNHGLIFLLDWSGSMQYELLETLKQTYNLIWFCRKAGIPFRVYAFQNAHHNEGEIHPAMADPKNLTLALTGDFCLLEFFSSKQNARSLEKSMEQIYLQAFAMNNGRICYCRKYTLGGTPLDQAVLCARELVSKLKKEDKVTKVNVIALTDGESNPMTYITKREEDSEWYGNREWHQRYICHSREKFILRDPITRYAKEISNSAYATTKDIVGFFKEITDYNWIGIRICNKRDLQRELRQLSYEEADTVSKQWTKEKFASVKKKLGFSESFFIPDKNLGLGTQDLEVKQKGEVASRAELNRAFKKHMGSKMANKTILNAFINQIA